MFSNVSQDLQNSLDTLEQSLIERQNITDNFDFYDTSYNEDIGNETEVDFWDFWRGALARVKTILDINSMTNLNHKVTQDSTTGPNLTTFTRAQVSVKDAVDRSLFKDLLSTTKIDTNTDETEPVTITELNEYFSTTVNGKIDDANADEQSNVNHRSDFHIEPNAIENDSIRRSNTVLDNESNNGNFINTTAQHDEVIRNIDSSVFPVRHLLTDTVTNISKVEFRNHDGQNSITTFEDSSFNEKDDVTTSITPNHGDKTGKLPDNDKNVTNVVTTRLKGQNVTSIQSGHVKLIDENIGTLNPTKDSMADLSNVMRDISKKNKKHLLPESNIITNRNEISNTTLIGATNGTSSVDCYLFKGLNINDTRCETDMAIIPKYVEPHTYIIYGAISFILVFFSLLISLFCYNKTKKWS